MPHLLDAIDHLGIHAADGAQSREQIAKHEMLIGRVLDMDVLARELAIDNPIEHARSEGAPLRAALALGHDAAQHVEPDGLENALVVHRDPVLDLEFLGMCVGEFQKRLHLLAVDRKPAPLDAVDKEGDPHGPDPHGHVVPDEGMFAGPPRADDAQPGEQRLPPTPFGQVLPMPVQRIVQRLAQQSLVARPEIFTKNRIGHPPRVKLEAPIPVVKRVRRPVQRNFERPWVHVFTRPESVPPLLLRIIYCINDMKIGPTYLVSQTYCRIEEQNCNGEELHLEGN
jgi:hypothetical protein